MQAAEIYLKQREIDKAIENWSRATVLNSEHPLAHSRLAMVHERLGHPQQAVTEYLCHRQHIAALRQSRQGTGNCYQSASTNAAKLTSSAGSIASQDRTASSTTHARQRRHRPDYHGQG